MAAHPDGPKQPPMARLRGLSAGLLAGDRALRAVLVVCLVGLVLRLAALGVRPAHFDEARVAYLAEYFAQTGAFEYRSIVHGPLIQHVNALLFSVIGPTDWASRLFVALVGAGLPATALTFRSRLDDVETVAVAFFLAFNPVLLYYSRFARSTILVATFMFAAFGLFVYAIDRRRLWPVYGGVFLVGLGVGAKENALVYLLCWVGASVLLVDRALAGPRSGADVRERLRALWSRTSSWVSPHRVALTVGHTFGLAAVLSVVMLFLYAPRGAGSPVVVGGQAVGLYGLLGSPEAAGPLLDATLADIQKIGYWFTQSAEQGGQAATVAELGSEYRKFAGQTLQTYSRHAAIVSVFGLFGLVHERYVSANPRPLVLFAGYWAVASAIGYPLGTDIFGSWITVNVIVPLTIPAAVLGARLVGRTREAMGSDDRLSAGLAAVLVILVVGQLGVATAQGVYLSPDSADGLAQYAQPSASTTAALLTIQQAGGPEGTPSVLVYGDRYVDQEPDTVGLAEDDIRVALEPSCLDYFESLPLPWYLYKDDLSTVCATEPAEFRDAMADSPAVVVGAVETEPFLDTALPTYQKQRFYLRTDAGDRKETILYVSPPA